MLRYHKHEVKCTNFKCRIQTVSMYVYTGVTTTLIKKSIKEKTGQFGRIGEDWGKMEADMV